MQWLLLFFFDFFFFFFQLNCTIDHDHNCCVKTTMSHQEIISKLPTCFENGLNSGDLCFFPSSLTKHVDMGVEVGHVPCCNNIRLVLEYTISWQFEIRLCPSLQTKTNPRTLNRSADSLATNSDLAVEGAEETKYGPFAPPYNPNLYIGNLQDTSGQDYTVLVGWRQMHSTMIAL